MGIITRCLGSVDKIMNMIVYVVQEIESYDCWGSPCYGDIYAIFYSRESAEKFCYQHHLEIGGGWPTAAIKAKEVLP